MGNNQRNEPAIQTKSIRNTAFWINNPSWKMIMERRKFPQIPPIFTIKPFRALAVLRVSGRHTSEYTANWVPVVKEVKKYPMNPNGSVKTKIGNGKT